MSTIYDAGRAYIKRLFRRGVRSSYGQFGEDAIVGSLLKQKEGVYVDVGAYHPMLYSNTYALYQRGWHGVVIDPNSSLKPLFSVFRARDTFVGSAIGATNGEGEYYMFDDAAYNTFDKSAAEEWQRARGLRLREVRRVPIVPLGEMLRLHHVTRVDYMNIDVEGMDLPVLRSHDWQVRPTVISIEDSTFNPDVPMGSEAYAFLRSKDYVLAGFSGMTLVFKDAAIGR